MNPAKGKGIPMWALRIDPHQQLSSTANIENRAQHRDGTLDERQILARGQAFEAAGGRTTAPGAQGSSDTGKPRQRMQSPGTPSQLAFVLWSGRRPDASNGRFAPGGWTRFDG